MTEFAPIAKTENPVARRIKSWEVVRNKWLLDEHSLQFDAEGWPNGRGELVKKARITSIIPSAAASDLIATIGPEELTVGGFVMIRFTPGLSKLSSNQRAIVYGLIASCCNPEKRPLDPPVEGLSYKFNTEFREFMIDLYSNKSDIYEKALSIRDEFTDRTRNLSTPFD